MKFLKKISNYILNRSNSYLFYKNGYESLMEIHNLDIKEIKKLNKQLNQLELKDEIILKQEKQTQQILYELTQLSKSNEHLQNTLDNFDNKSLENNLITQELIQSNNKSTHDFIQFNNKKTEILQQKNDKILNLLNLLSTYQNMEISKIQSLSENISNISQVNQDELVTYFKSLQSFNVNLMDNIEVSKNEKNLKLQLFEESLEKHHIMMKDLINELYEKNEILKNQTKDIQCSLNSLENYHVDELSKIQSQQQELITKLEFLQKLSDDLLENIGEINSQNSTHLKQYEENMLKQDNFTHELIKKNEIISKIQTNQNNLISQIDTLEKDNRDLLKNVSYIKEQNIQLQSDITEFESLFNKNKTFFEQKLENFYKFLQKYIEDNSDLTKIEILNKLSYELHHGNYTNLDAYKKIKEMGLFDEIYYKKEYDFDKDIDALLHYIYKGYEENKNPSKLFDNTFYKSSEKNIAESSLNPLVYFVTKGINEGFIKFNPQELDVYHINKYEINEKIKEFDEVGITKTKRKPRIIVSLTSFPERMYDIHYCLYSLLTQDCKPDEIILWLGENEFPERDFDIPNEVLKLKQYGLTIKFTKDIKSYTKIIPALKEYPTDIIVTADDDIYYPKNWLKLLYEDYLQNPEYIICHRCRRMVYENKEFAEYEKWKLINENSNDISYLNFFTGVGGVLYPPNSLHKNVLKEEIFLDLCEFGDDIWLWSMAVLNHTKIKVANNHNSTELTYINPARERNLINEKTLWSTNITENHNNKQLDKIINKYPQIIKIIEDS